MSVNLLRDSIIQDNYTDKTNNQLSQLEDTGSHFIDNINDNDKKDDLPTVSNSNQPIQVFYYI